MRFLDSSAIVKLALDEPESASLVEYLDYARFTSSGLSRTEVVRAVLRREPSRVALAQDIVAQAILVSVSPTVLATAARVGPSALRSLDAIQLASALEVGGELTAFVAYDERLLAAASALGLPVASPGA